MRSEVKRKYEMMCTSETNLEEARMKSKSLERRMKRSTEALSNHNITVEQPLKEQTEKIKYAFSEEKERLMRNLEEMYNKIYTNKDKLFAL